MRGRCTFRPACDSGLAIARSLLAGNPLIFLDEPTVKLDPLGAQRVRAFIADLRLRFGVTVVLTTHDMLEADELCDRIAILEHGRLIALDTPAKLKRLVAREQTTEVIAGRLEPGLADAIRSWPATIAAEVIINDPETGGGIVRIHSADSENTTEALLRLLASRGVDVLGVTSGEPTLEDVFFTLTGRGLE